MLRHYYDTCSACTDFEKIPKLSGKEHMILSSQKAMGLITTDNAIDARAQKRPGLPTEAEFREIITRKFLGLSETDALPCDVVNNAGGWENTGITLADMAKIAEHCRQKGIKLASLAQKKIHQAVNAAFEDYKMWKVGNLGGELFRAGVVVCSYRCRLLLVCGGVGSPVVWWRQKLF